MNGKRCTRCGEVKSIDSFHKDGRCGFRPDCKKCTNARVNTRYAKNLASGRCTECGRVRENPCRTRCDICRTKGPARKNKIVRARGSNPILNLAERQFWRCAVTGVPITVDTMEVDRIMPKSRGGNNELTNLRIVHRSVNQMKRNLTDEELLEWSRRIVAGLSVKQAA